MEKELKFCSKSDALENASLSFLKSSFSVLELERRTKLLEVVKIMNTVITNVSQQIKYLNISHEVLTSKVSSLLREELYHIRMTL